MAGRAPQANAAPHRTRRPHRESWGRGPDRRRSRHHSRRAALDGRQAQKRAGRTGASAMGRKGEASVRGGAGDTRRHIELIRQFVVDARQWHVACFRLGIATLKLEREHCLDSVQKPNAISNTVDVAAVRELHGTVLIARNSSFAYKGMGAKDGFSEEWCQFGVKLFL